MLEDNWNEKQRLTIWDMEINGGNQEQCAKRMNTTQPTVARRLAEGNYSLYIQTKETIKGAIQRLDGGRNDN